jgi:molybdopterin adenylyltransferase
MAQIKSIVYQPDDQVYEDGRFDTFIRLPVKTAELIADHGIRGDHKAGRNRQRQLNLLSVDWLKVQQQKGYRIEPGSFGEQLIVQGIDLEALKPGTRLQLGNKAIIEITKPRTGCERLDAAQGDTGYFAEKEIGMMATVITGGTIQVGDVVTYVRIATPIE